MSATAGLQPGCRNKSLFTTLKQGGVGVDLIVDPIHYNTTASAIISSISQNYPLPDALEGLNEVDNNGWSNWVSIAQTQQQQLYQAAKADSNLAKVPVLNFTLTKSTSYSLVGNMTAYMDYGNFHPYPGGRNPESGIVGQINLQTPVSGSKPLMATETGYHADINSTTTRSQGDWPVNDTVFATYYLRMLLENFRLGIKRTYGYEFLDEQPDPGLSTQELEYGLVRDDWSLTPAYASTKNLISLLSDPGVSFTPGSLTYSLTGTTASTHSVLMQKHDGSFWLAVWQADQIWGGTTRQVISTPTASITLNLAQAATVSQYHPDVNTSSSQVSSSATTYNFTSGPNVTLIKVSSPTTKTPVLGDINGDGAVDILDFSILASNWGKPNATAGMGDLNGDGKVDILDLSILATAWGK